MILWMLGLAWGDALHLPADQSPEMWRDALALTGLTIADTRQDADAALLLEGNQWVLQVRMADGTWRTAHVSPPSSTANRESIARTVLLMQAERSSVSHPWTLPPDTLPAPPLPIETKPEETPTVSNITTQERTTAWRTPPNRPMEQPPMGQAELPPIYPSVMPQQTLSSLDVLQPTHALSTPSTPSSQYWAWLEGGGTVRPGSALGTQLALGGGVYIHPKRRVGMGMGWNTPVVLTDLRHFAGDVQTSTLHVGLWQMLREEQLPIAIGGGGGLSRMAFSQEDRLVRAVALPMLFVEAMAGDRVQFGTRISGDIGRLTLEEVVDDTPQTAATLSSFTVWLGVRLVLENKDEG